MKRNAPCHLGIGFAPSFHRPFLRYFAPVEGEGRGDGADGSEFKPPASQEELNRIIADRVSRAERNAREDERRKLAAAPKPEPKPDPKPEPKPNDGTAVGLTEDDVQKRIDDALAAKDLELAVERVSDQLDKALEGRVYAASKLFGLDRKQFVKEDGKTVDGEALTAWVEKNSTEAPEPKRRTIPGQGERGETTGLESGKTAYEQRHPKKN